MLPGFRFLFAATILTMSIVIFGLGAAALLRATHEEFVSIPSRRQMSETLIAQQAPMPTLATVRDETPTETIGATSDAASMNDVVPDVKDDANVAPRAEPTMPIADIVETPLPVALDTSMPETIQVEDQPRPQDAATPAVAAAAPAPAEVETAPAEQRHEEITTAAVTTPPSQEAIPDIAPLPTADAAEPSHGKVRIATLGGPPVDIEQPAVKTPSVVKKPIAAKPKPARPKLVRRTVRRQQTAVPSFVQPSFAQQPFAQQPFAQPAFQQPGNPFGGFPR